ncbi:MAG: pantetheine-phosphate adenylyltransferase [Lactovum sp.]
MKNKKIALFTGSFDPITNGHLDIIYRASDLFDFLYLGVFENPEKNSLFSLEERLKMIEDNISALKNVSLVQHPKDLTVRIAKELNVTSLLRSLRTGQDFDYEQNMSYFNYKMTGVETLFLSARPELSMISSSRIRELASYAEDVSAYVPENVVKELKKKYEK